MKHTVRELAGLIGTHVLLEPAKGLQFRCRVINAKTSYGRPRVEIEAVEGHGKAWVAFESVVPCYENGTQCRSHENGAPSFAGERKGGR